MIGGVVEAIGTVGEEVAAMLADRGDWVFVVILHALARDSIEERPVVIGLIADDAVMARRAVLAGVVAVLALVDCVVLVGVVPTHVLAQVGCQVEVVIAEGALPGLHVEDHRSHSVER